VSSIRTIEPGLLLAAPRLGDPNFEDTVVLLGLHDDADGSLGWTVNGAVVETAATIVRATGLVGASDPLPSGFDRAAVRGGPVSPESVWILYRRGPDDLLLPGSIEVGTEIAVTATAAALELLVAGEGPSDFHLLIGYAGWGPGQLARELGEGAWLPADADPDLLFDAHRDKLWELGYARVLGSVPAAFVTSTRGSA
jgi:putative transcriptional regulator